MTSGNFTSFPVSSIFVNRAERQRRVLTGIEDLAASIARTGLIHPLVITREGELIAGERRYTAIQSLGWTHVPVQFAEDLDPLALQLLELEENTRRVDIDWKDQCQAVDRYHKLCLSLDPAWNAEQTAAALGMSSAEVSEKRAVASELISGNTMVSNADRYSVARGIVQRTTARKKTEALNVLVGDTEGDGGKSETSSVPIQRVDFHDWSASYSGLPFNFIHCDFPYGVRVGGHGQAADQAFGNYDDDPDTYWRLLDTLGNSLYRICDDTAHLMFWFSMKHYERTRLRLMEMGWQVNQTPLVWGKSDNTGILPAHQYGPRQCYETAFHCFRGKRPIVQAVSNIYWGPSPKSIHMSEKPLAMLEHFFRMYVDGSTHMLDPTCGSANALKAALRHGAPRVLGLERDESFYSAALAAWD